MSRAAKAEAGRREDAPGRSTEGKPALESVGEPVAPTANPVDFFRFMTSHSSLAGFNKLPGDVFPQLSELSL
ncbi:MULTISPECIES: hypothetical protein [unclassified Mesorhizobium]|uniref:hypothetical protein n=1 Tax=unclassified Mesorhizobium TaxID=325217 RepID=UPI0015E45957|nr:MULTISPECIES: hypothetical protein [unclassified Mesorhizobium]MBZ9811310.1 hypothetical protein [Mesorhizobium sp. ESP-6-2]